MWSLEFIGFSDSEFVLVVEDKEDVVVAPWDVGNFSKVWVVATVWVDFALFGGDVATEVASTSSSFLWLDHGTSVQVQHFQVDEVQVLSWEDTGW